MEPTNQKPEQELTAEQLAEQKENMLTFYTESLPYLNAQLAYEELLVKIDEAAYYYKKSVRNFGKSTPYYLENIKKIELLQPKERSIQTVWEASPWIRGGERIEFEYLGKVIRFGRKLEEKEAKLLFNLVTKRIEERMRKIKN